jgi:hypothetical protein
MFSIPKRFRKAKRRKELGNPERMEAIGLFGGTPEKIFRKRFSLLRGAAGNHRTKRGVSRPHLGLY